MSRFQGRLLNRIAVITGASRGIGRATALTLAREGASVVVNYQSGEAKAKEVSEEIKKMGGTAIAFQADVGDSAAVERMIKRTMDEFSRVDILVNNAGVLQGGGSLLDLKDEELDRMVQVNVKGIIYCTKAVVPGMMKRHQGKIVNLASVAGLGTASLPGNLVYSSTKAAVIALTKRIALELGQYGVNVNAVAPGLIRTDMGMGYRPADEQKERIQYFKERSILGRIGEPEDIANAILFLSSAESDFITGQVITVDGGRTDFLSHSS